MPNDTSHPSRTCSARRRLTGGLLAVALLTGVGTAAASPAAAAPAATAATVQAAAPVYTPVGLYPDPIVCTLAGLTTGRSFYCSWYWFLWQLHVA